MQPSLLNPYDAERNYGVRSSDNHLSNCCSHARRTTQAAVVDVIEIGNSASKKPKGLLAAALREKMEEHSSVRYERRIRLIEPVPPV